MPRSMPVIFVASLVLTTGPAWAEQTASFLGDKTYATVEGCEKLKALAAGGDRNISTVPETLSAKGFDGWEHSCAFKSVTEQAAGKSWNVVSSCEEGESQWDDTQVFEKADDKSFKVLGEGEEEATVYTVCDAPPAKKDN
jgi:hypothetical protein